MVKPVGSVPGEPVRISPRFTLEFLPLPGNERSLWSSRIFTAFQVVLDGSYEHSVLAEAGSGFAVRLTDLVTGHTVDDPIGAWNAQVEADLDTAVKRLQKLSDAEIVEAFFEQLSE